MNNIESPKGRILVVDDNEDVLLSLNMLLKPYVEAVRVTAKPERTIEFMDSFHPDVIILDMNFSRDAISGEEGYECSPAYWSTTRRAWCCSSRHT